MCLTLLHCLKKKCTKPILASIFFILRLQQLPWKVILNSSPLTSFFTESSLISPLKCILPDTVKHTFYLNPDILISPLQSLNFHPFVMLLVTSSLPLLFVFWFGIQHISFLFFPTFHKESKHSISCLCPFSFSFHTIHTTLKLQSTQYFEQNNFISCVLKSQIHYIQNN